ncbi:MAG: acyl carrier protein [Clostridiales bacterium]|nr:acyl carrier protein [Clostridiales bacterium]
MFEDVKNQIAEILGIDEETITLESNLITDLRADSMDIATLLLEVEENHGIEIDEDELENLKTVGDIVKYIEANKK